MLMGPLFSKLLLLLFFTKISGITGYAIAQVRLNTSVRMFEENIEKAKVLEFYTDSLLLTVLEVNAKQYKEGLYSANTVKRITLKEGKNSGRGALKGLMVGAVLGTLIGISIGASEPGTANGFGWGNASVGQGIVGASLVVIPISTITGLLVGARNKHKYQINGNHEKYHEHIEEMKILLNR